MMPWSFRVIPAALAALAPALAGAATIAVLPPVNSAEFPQQTLQAVESAIEAELKAEPGLEVISMTRVQEIWSEARPCPEEYVPEECFSEILKSLSDADMLILSQISRGPGGAWLSVKIHRIPGGKMLGQSRLKAVTVEDAAERAREAVAEARGRRAELAPERGMEARVGETVVDGVALEPAGAVIRPEPSELKPAGQVLEPQREVLEVAAGTGRTKVPVEPAGAVIEPQPSDSRPAGSVIEPQPSETRPAGAVIEPRRETIRLPGDEGGRRWSGAQPSGAAPGATEGAERAETEWYTGWAALGLGVALGGTAIYFAGQLRDGKGDHDDNLIAAQITGGLALAATVTGVTLLLLSRQEGGPSASADVSRATGPAPRCGLGVAPVHGGVVAGFATSF